MLELRQYQRKALEAIERRERKGVLRQLVVHPTGAGKGHPLATEVPTPRGWRKWGELSVGDLLFGSDGRPTRITGVYDRGVLATYEVEFSDGSMASTDAEHLWSVRDQRYRRTRHEAAVVTTEQMMREGLRDGRLWRWRIPVAGVERPDVDLPIDSYTLGALIANGSLASVGTTLTTPDERVVARVARSHEINRVKGEACPRYSLPGLCGTLRDLGLNVLSAAKFLPDSYLAAGTGQRIALLQGLMDGDGSSRGGGRRSVNYHTTSPRLAENVRELVTSLGGTASVRSIPRQGPRRAYEDITISILLPLDLSAWSSSRKMRDDAPRRAMTPRRAVVAIRRVEDQEIRCISVAAPDSLYVVGRDHIVTHNTVTFSHLIAQRAAQRAVVLVHRDELVHQTVDKMRLIAPELSVGVVKAERNEFTADVVVASVQTAMRESRLAPLVQQRFKTVIVDEAHHAVAPSWKRVLEHLGCLDEAYAPLTVGFTATPERDKGGGLGGIWQEVVAYRSIREMIYEGYLSPVSSQVADTSADFSSVRTSGGDLLASELGEAMDNTVIEEIAAAYATYAPLRKGVAFTPTVDTAHRLADALMARSISAEPVWGAMPPEQRKAALHRLRTGETQVVTNCAVLTEGFDEPSVDCILIARPTKSHALYVQMVGRGLRKHPGKADCLVLDVVGVTDRHDLVAVVDLGVSWSPGRLEAQEEGVGDVGEGRCELCGRPVSYGSRHPSCRASRTARMDTFATSKMRWLPVGDGYCLGTDSGVILMREIDEGLWRLAEYAQGRIEVLHESLPADWAQGIGEDRAKAFGRLSRRDARWLAEEPTPAQLNRLLREGLPEEKLERIKTRGQAADLITRIQGRRAMRKLVGA